MHKLHHKVRNGQNITHKSKIFTKYSIQFRQFLDNSKTTLQKQYFSQSHDGLLLEPMRTPGRAMTDFSQKPRPYFQNLENSKTR